MTWFHEYNKLFIYTPQTWLNLIPWIPQSNYFHFHLHMLSKTFTVTTTLHKGQTGQGQRAIFKNIVDLTKVKVYYISTATQEIIFFSRSSCWPFIFMPQAWGQLHLHHFSIYHDQVRVTSFTRPYPTFKGQPANTIKTDCWPQLTSIMTFIAQPITFKITQ
jgi:hypothetical protein